MFSSVPIHCWIYGKQLQTNATHLHVKLIPELMKDCASPLPLQVFDGSVAQVMLFAAPLGPDTVLEMYSSYFNNSTGL